MAEEQAADQGRIDRRKVREGLVVSDSMEATTTTCGGSCACATCHVYVAPEWLDKIEPQGQEERDILDSAFDVRSNSRLSCQFTFKPELAGLHVTLSHDAAG